MFRRGSIDAVAHALLEAVPASLLIVVVVFPPERRMHGDHWLRHGAGVADRHLRDSCSASASRSTRCRSSAWFSPSASSSTTPSSWWTTQTARRAGPAAAVRGDEARDRGSTDAVVADRARARRGVRCRPRSSAASPGSSTGSCALTIAISTFISAFRLADVEPRRSPRGCCWPRGAARSRCSAASNFALLRLGSTVAFWMRALRPRLVRSTRAASSTGVARGGGWR